MAAVLGAIIALIGILDWANVEGVAGTDSDFASISVGAGLVLTALAGFALVAGSVWAFVVTPKDVKAAPPDPRRRRRAVGRGRAAAGGDGGRCRHRGLLA